MVVVREFCSTVTILASVYARMPT